MSKALNLLPAVVLCSLMVLGLLACKTPKNTAFFQTLSRDTTLSNTVSKNFDLKIKPGDQLAISITSASPELSGLFTAPPGSIDAAGSGYLVDERGNIQMYKLGNIKAAGLTRVGLNEALQKELTPYLKDPLVSVRFVNQRVTVLGAVGNPGVIPITADQITVLEAIGRSGDLAENSKRENVLVIRQTERGKEFKHLNLLDHSVFTSPYFFLQNEDVVYVEPEPQREAVKTQQTISYVISGISILSLILTRIR